MKYMDDDMDMERSETDPHEIIDYEYGYLYKEDEDEEEHFGIWGNLRRSILKEEHYSYYKELLDNGKLEEHCRKFQKEAEDYITRYYDSHADDPEWPDDVLGHTRYGNNLIMQAQEHVVYEMARNVGRPVEASPQEYNYPFIDIDYPFTDRKDDRYFEQGLLYTPTLDFDDFKIQRYALDSRRKYISYDITKLPEGIWKIAYANRIPDRYGDDYIGVIAYYREFKIPEEKDAMVQMIKDCNDHGVYYEKYSPDGEYCDSITGIDWIYDKEDEYEDDEEDEYEEDEYYDNWDDDKY